MARRCAAVRRTAERDDCARRIRRLRLHHRHKWARITSEDCHKGERRSGQRGKRSREYDRSTKSDRQIASTTKPRLRQCVTARQRPHFPLHQSQQHGRCRRKGSSEYEKSRLFITNRRLTISIFLTYDTGNECLLWNALGIIPGGTPFFPPQVRCGKKKCCNESCRQ